MKIVINKCFGGFSISTHAIKRLCELRGRPCYFARNSNFEDEHWISVDGEKTGFGIFAFDVPVEEINRDYAYIFKEWPGFSEEKRSALNAWWTQHAIENRPANRADPLLIQVVEELGDKANGEHARLEIVEIPDGIEYEIEEYDGLEHIAEAHRTWG